MRHLRARTCLAITAAALLAGCGTTTTTRSAPAPQPAAGCGHSGFHGAGECIKAELRSKGFKLIPRPRTGTGALCVDVSRWQGLPDWAAARRAGLRCAIVQTNDGLIGNPFFWLQVAGLNAQHLPWGTYTFLEGRDPVAQAELSANMAGRVVGEKRSLGMVADAEQSSAYPVTCAYVNEAARLSRLVGTYGSPGTYRGGRCQGYNWPACWGSGRKCPLPGYPASAVVLQQTCGTCRLAGFSGEVDLDRDYGLLALAHPPVPLHVLIVRRHKLRGLLAKHHCRQPPWHVSVDSHGKPDGHYEHACHAWLAEGARVNHEIRGRATARTA